jgi:UDP-glucose 4-epimerase
MKILITGGAGYIGYALVQQLMMAPEVAEIVVYDNLSRRSYAFFDHHDFRAKPLRFIQGDILDGRKLSEAVRGMDVVYHLAARVTTPFADFDAHHFDQINHWGTAQISLAVEEAAVPHLIYLSSVSVYGTSNQAVTEASPPNPKTYYAIAKLAGEEQVRRLGNKTRVHIIRSGNVYGYNPCYRIDAVINRFAFEAHFAGRVTIQGTGEQERAFIHVSKLASGLRQLLNNPTPPGTYNLAEHNMSVNDVIAALRPAYPELETLNVNPNMPRRNIRLALPCPLWEALNMPQRTLAEELADFRRAFAF